MPARRLKKRVRSLLFSERGWSHPRVETHLPAGVTTPAPVRHRRACVVRVDSGKLRPLNWMTTQRCLHSRYALAAMAGLLLAAAFPKPGLASLAWIAPGLILFAAIGTSGGQAFRIGYVAGLAHYLASLHWLLFIPFPAGAVLGWFSLSAYLALYPATWVWLGWKMLSPPGRANAAITTSAGALSGNPSDTARNAFLPSLAGFALRRWHQRFLWYLFCASLWVALELLIGWFLSGFPWNLLGASQYAILPIIQIASFTGVY